MGIVAAAAATLLAAGVFEGASRTEAGTGPQEGTAEVRILGLNDLHGHLEPPHEEGGRPVGGVAALAGYMDLYEAENPGPTFRVHSGDMVGGSQISSDYFHDDPAVEAMNLMDLELGAPGNHTFDKGPDELRRLIRGGEREGGVSGFDGADFPYLAANVVERGSGQTALPPYQVLQEDGVKVGFIGVVTPETPETTSAESAERFRFLDLSESVDRYAGELRGQGVNTVVVLAHSGGDQEGGAYSGEVFEETAEMEGVDLVLAGHTHQRHEVRVGGVPVLQSDPYGAGLSVADLEVDRETGRVRGVDTRLVTAYADGPTDPELAGHTERYVSKTRGISEREVGAAAEPVTRSTTASGESALGDFTADAPTAPLPGRSSPSSPPAGCATTCPRAG